MLPIARPLEPMLASPVDDLPADHWYEPKWDGFRTLVFRDGDDIHLDSRNGREITRFFPEVVAAVAAELPTRCVLDGEIILIGDDGVLDFPALQLRLHPAATRVATLAAKTPVVLVVFDVLAVGGQELSARPFSERRAVLTGLLGGAGRVKVTPATTDPHLAQRWFIDLEGAGLDGLIAKDPALPYVPGKRVMAKLKHRRTADCVVAGYRPHKSGPDAVGSLLLGLYDHTGAEQRLQPVGVVGALPMAKRRDLVSELSSLVVTPDEHPWPWGGQPPSASSGAGSRWSPGKSLAFVPLAPERVLQVRYDAMQGNRFRHMAQFDRWRPDRAATSCTFEQLARPTPWRVEQLWSAQ